MKQVNAGSTAHLTVGWKDGAGAAILSAPTSLTYSLKCLTTGTVLRNNVAFTAPGGIADLLISTTDTAIQRAANRVETKQITTVAVFGAETETADYQFQVRRVL